MSPISLTRHDAEELAHSTFVNSVVFYDEVASTSDAALTTAHDSKLLPALHIATHQTAGRGRGSNRWYSTHGALTFSLVIDATTLHGDPARWPRLSLWTALAICDAVAAFTPQADVQVKWPNDVFLSQRKVCGILIENAPATNRFVVGVGINVNNEFVSPESTDVPLEAISIRQARRQVVDIAEVARAVMLRLEESWQLFANEHSIRQAWQPHCLLTGRQIQWHSGEQVADGICQGIDDDGALLLTKPNAELPIQCFGGTVTYR